MKAIGSYRTNVMNVIQFNYRSLLMCVIISFNSNKLFEVGISIKAIEIVSNHLVTENVVILKKEKNPIIVSPCI